MTKDSVITYNGKRYKLVRDAELDDLEFYAPAICVSEPHCDVAPLHILIWSVKDEYLGYNGIQRRHFILPDCCEDESQLVDWSDVWRIISRGWYDVDEDGIYW